MVEGEFDALSLAQECGNFISVVATGTTQGSHTPRWIAQLARKERVFVALDAEEKGVLHFVEGLDYQDISDISGVAAGTLRVRAHRARTLLRSSLGPVVDTWMRLEEQRDVDAARSRANVAEERRRRVLQMLQRRLDEQLDLALKEALFDPANARVREQFDMPLEYYDTEAYRAFVARRAEYEKAMVERLKLRID